MKTLIKTLILLACLVSIDMQAQVQVTLSVNSNPSPKLADWMDKPEVGTLTITNTQADLVGTPYKIFATLELDGKKIAETDKSKMPLRILEEGTEILQMDEIVPFDALKFYGTVQKDIITTGFIPPGHYLLCVSLKKEDDLDLASPARTCVGMLITDYQMPELIFPNNIAITKEILQGTMFTWSPVTPNPTPELGLKYIIAITEVQEEQTPAQAFSINQPIIQEELENTTSFNWPTDVEAESGKKYVWSIKPVREDGTAYKTTNDGYVAIATFQTKKDRNPMLGKPKWKNLCDCEGLINPSFKFSIPDTTNIRKLKIEGIAKLKETLFTKCNKNINKNNATIDVQVGWYGVEKPNKTTGTDTYAYPKDKGTPDEIFVRATILPIKGSETDDESCEKLFYVEVPDLFKISPVTNDSLIFYSNCGGNTRFEFKAEAKNIRKSGNTFSGKGHVFIEWLNARVAVKFLNVELNAEKEIIAGKIQSEIDKEAPKFPIIWGVEGLGNTNWANSSAEKVTKWIKDKTGKSISYKSAKKKIKPVKMPLGLNFKQGIDQLAITEMQFTKDKAMLNIVAAKSIPSNWNSTVAVVGFLAKKIEFTQFDITTFRRIELIEDIACNNTNSKIDFKFKKPRENASGENDAGCYIEWGENGFSKFGLQLECSFTKEWLKPTDDRNRVVAKLSTEASDWDNLIFEGSLSPAEIVGTNGMVFSVNNIIYDMSDIRNSPNIKFPRGYEGDKGNTFRGFYAKEISIKMPKVITESTGQELSINAKNLLIDNMGITLDASVSNDSEEGFGRVSIADLAANINSANIKIVSSSLIEAGFGGQIKLPISSAKFDYNAMFHVAGQNSSTKDYVQLSITPPKEEIKSELFKSRLKLDRNTSLIAYLSKDTQKFGLNINGKFLFYEKISLGKLDFSLPGIKVQNMEMSYNKADNDLNLNAGTWGILPDSQQEKIENFAFSFTKVGFDKLESKEGEKLRAKLKIGGRINLAKAVAGSTTLGLVGIINDDFEPKCVETTIDKVKVNADLSVVGIDGELEFFKEDRLYGDGFHGNFGVFFTPIDLRALAEIYFGKKDDYSYWKVEADAYLPAGAGIPFLGNLAFRRFGGGAYYNMKALNKEKIGEPIKFIPSKPSGGSRFGFIANTTIATMGIESTFNADAKLTAQFSTNNGLEKLDFDGDFYVGANLKEEQRNHAKIKGTVGVDFDFVYKSFDLNALGKVQAYDIITGRAGFKLHLDSEKWYLHFGTPETPNNVNVYGIRLYEYLMCGNAQVNAPDDFTDGFKYNYHKYLHRYPGSRTFKTGIGEGQPATLGEGFAFGLGWKFNKKFYEEDAVLWCDVWATIAAGAEINLALLKYQGNKGINGWRAKGGLGIYAHASLGCCIGSVGASGGAWIYGEFPNPYYASGGIDAIIDLGFFGEYSYHKSFKVGQKYAGTLEKSTFDTSVYDADKVIPDGAKKLTEKTLIENITPEEVTSGTDIPPINVKLNFEPNREYVYKVLIDSVNRTFETRRIKVIYEVSLEHTKYWYKSDYDGGEYPGDPYNVYANDWVADLQREKHGTLHYLTGCKPKHDLEVIVNGMGEYSYCTKQSPVDTIPSPTESNQKYGEMLNNSIANNYTLDSTRIVAPDVKLTTNSKFSNVSDLFEQEEAPKKTGRTWEENSSYTLTIEARAIIKKGDEPWEIYENLQEKKTFDFRTWTPEFREGYDAAYAKEYYDSTGKPYPGRRKREEEEQQQQE